MSLNEITSGMDDPKEEDIPDTALVAWERRQYRLYRPVWVSMANKYVFLIKLWKFFYWSSFYTGTVVTAFWFSKDKIWEVFMAVWKVLG